MENHNNLTEENKINLGFCASIIKQKAGFIFEFEHSKYKDYDKLAVDIFYCNQRFSEYRDKITDLPSENLKLFNDGIYTGLINPNRLSYVAYY